MQNFRSLGMRVYEEEALTLLVIMQYRGYLNGYEFYEEVFLKLLRGKPI